MPVLHSVYIEVMHHGITQLQLHLNANLLTDSVHYMMLAIVLNTYMPYVQNPY